MTIVGNVTAVNQQNSSTSCRPLKLMLSVAQLAVQGYNSSTFPIEAVLPHVASWDVAMPVIDPYAGGLVSVNGALAAADADWSDSPPDGDETTPPLDDCAMAINYTWRTARSTIKNTTGVW